MAYELIEAKLGKPLRRRVTDSRRQGKSWEAIARDLHAATGVAVTGETLRNWFSDLSDQPEQVSA